MLNQVSYYLLPPDVRREHKMAKEVTDAQFNKLVAEVKKNPGQSERHYSEASGIASGQIGPALWRAEPVADPSLKIKATGAAIVNAREKLGLRWPRIAARTGLSVTEVKSKFEEHSGKSASESYSGRGRNFSNGGGTTKSSGSGRKTGAGRKAGTSGRRAAAKTKTAAAPSGGRKTAGRGRKAKTAGRSAGRARTRADRTAKSGDPQ